MKNKKIFILLFFLTSLFIFTPSVNAKTVNLYLFYGSTCPHCEAEINYIESNLTSKNIKLHKYEVWGNTENQELWDKVQDKLNVPSKGVPYLVIGGDHVLQGFRENSTESTIEYYIDYYKNHDYTDKVESILDPSKAPVIENITEKPKQEANNAKQTTFDIPIIGKVNAKSVSIPLIATIMGFVDGFNPCAMWILLFLITMLFDMKNRKKMWILGSIFILTSGIVYLLFMVSWLNLAMFVNDISYIKILIALLALSFGAINVIRFFKKQNEIGCDVTNKKERKRIITQIKNIVANKKFILSIIGIITLAISVNIIELFCSLGLPVMFTEILSLNQFSNFEHIIYLFIYILFFLIDDIIIFIIAMKTLKISAVSNKYAKVSHLVGGIIMLLIGLLMLIKPEWLMFNF